MVDQNQIAAQPELSVHAQEISGVRQTTLAGMRGACGDPAVIASLEPLAKVVDHFKSNPHDVGVLVTNGPRFEHLVSRDWVSEQLARPYFRELFLLRPLAHLLKIYGVTPLEIPESTDIPTAIEQALSRPGAVRYHPLVVLGDDGRRWLLDIYTLLLQQCRVLSSTLRELEEQRRATQVAQLEREKLQHQLLDASRDAGRAEVATGVLHNVGNVLNSVNVSAAMINKTLQQSKVGNLGKSVALFEEHGDDLATFLTQDERGRRVPGYLSKLAGVLAQEHQAMSQEMNSLGQSLEHVRRVVAMQQSYAKDSNLREPIRPAELMEDALRVNLASFERHNVQVARDYEEIPPLPLDKHKVLQILINLISNAKNAVKSRGPQNKLITLRICLKDRGGARLVCFCVIDNGVGIPQENLTRIFTHGFTTRKEGHGFGLHSAANAAREMGGSLLADSGGPEQGATFTLEVPATAPSVAVIDAKVAA